MFLYDYRGKFNAMELLPLIERYEITTFCAPPTISWMLILADLKAFDFWSCGAVCRQARR